MKHTIKNILTGSLVFALVFTPAVFAQEADSEDDSTVSDTSRLEQRRLEAKRKLQARLDQAKETRTERVDEAKSNLRERLSDAKKSICERRESKINQIMERMDTRRTNAFDRVTQIYEAITGFYTEKSLSVENYDSLVAAIVVAKEAAQAGIDNQQAVPQLDCDGDQPKADIADFKQRRLDSIDAMKAYRDAVKDLASAVKEVAEANRTTKEDS